MSIIDRNARRFLGQNKYDLLDDQVAEWEPYLNQEVGRAIRLAPEGDREALWAYADQEANEIAGDLDTATRDAVWALIVDSVNPEWNVNVSQRARLSRRVVGDGGYAPVPGEPFRWLETPQYSSDHLKFKEMFPNGVPMRDEDMTPEQLEYWRSNPKISLNEQSGHGESGLDDVEVTDDNADEEPMWPWEIEGRKQADWSLTEDEVWRQDHPFPRNSTTEVECLNCKNVWYGTPNIECPNCKGSNVQYVERPTASRKHADTTGMCAECRNGTGKFGGKGHDCGDDCPHPWPFVNEEGVKVWPWEVEAAYDDYYSGEDYGDENGAAVALEEWDEGYWDDEPSAICHVCGYPEDEYSPSAICDHGDRGMTAKREFDPPATQGNVWGRGLLPARQAYFEEGDAVEIWADDGRYDGWFGGYSVVGVEGNEVLVVQDGAPLTDSEIGYYKFDEVRLATLATQEPEDYLPEVDDFPEPDDNRTMFPWVTAGFGSGNDAGYEGWLAQAYENGQYAARTGMPHNPPGDPEAAEAWERGWNDEISAANAVDHMFEASSDSPCNCENSACASGTHFVPSHESDEDHLFTTCPNEGTIPCAYIGQICEACAVFMPDKYLGKLATQTPDEYLVDPDADVNAEPTTDTMFPWEAEGDLDWMRSFSQLAFIDPNVAEDDPAWPWDLQEPGDGAADVADVPTPGQSEDDYPQPTASRKTAVNLTPQFITDWLFTHWITRNPENEAEVACLLSNPDNWKYLDVYAERGRDMRSGEDDWKSDVDDMGVDHELGFALTGLIEGGHKGPHQDTCPLKNDPYSASKTAGVPVEWPEGACYSHDDASYCILKAGHEGEHDRRSENWINNKLNGGSAFDRNDAWASKTAGNLWLGDESTEFSLEWEGVGEAYVRPNYVINYANGGVGEEQSGWQWDALVYQDGGAQAVFRGAGTADTSEAAKRLAEGWLQDNAGVFNFGSKTTQDKTAVCVNCGHEVETMHLAGSGVAWWSKADYSQTCAATGYYEPHQVRAEIIGSKQALEEPSGYDIFHQECDEWHSIPGTGVVVCDVTGESFEIGRDVPSVSWPGELKDSEGFDRGQRISRRKTGSLDWEVLKSQIGAGNLAAVSGFRVERIDENTVRLPVAQGYAVEITLNAWDTYDVTRTYRGNVKKSWEGVYGDQIGEIAYQASLFTEGKKKVAADALVEGCIGCIVIGGTPVVVKVGCPIHDDEVTAKLAAQVKVCDTCGKAWSASSTYCGSDGTPLGDAIEGSAFDINSKLAADTDDDGSDEGEGAEGEEVDDAEETPEDGTAGELTIAEEVGADKDEGDPVDIEPLASRRITDDDWDEWLDEEEDGDLGEGYFGAKTAGAVPFENEGSGSTVREAWENARSGYSTNGGYSGTIAEKDGYFEWRPPVSAREAVDALQNVEFVYDDEENDNYDGKHMLWDGSGYKPLPSWLTERIIEAYDDKWGPAIAIPNGSNSWLFVGWASY